MPGALAAYIPQFRYALHDISPRSSAVIQGEYVQGTRRLDEQDMRALLQNTSSGEPLIQAFIDKYVEQGERRGEATMLLRLLERKFGPPSEPVRDRIIQADAETLLCWFDLGLTAHSLDEVLH